MNQEILKKDEKMSDWWLGTVGLTFSPVVISVIIDLCAYGRVDFGGLIGDGELILSAFLINAPSLLNYGNKSVSALSNTQIRRENFKGLGNGTPLYVSVEINLISK